mmetsp:Transcript_30366/g.93729  ORF Transcript_30366/g.93729 Transcript_30366/m.93729 type:complete len:345 (-) Transcript_30366:16-1050(-)
MESTHDVSKYSPTMNKQGPSQLLDKLRDNLEGVADEAVVGHLEERRVGVGVHDDDRLAVLHACEVLDRARHAEAHVQVRGDDLAGLADLQVRRGVAGVDDGAGGADGGLALVGEREHELLEALLVLEAAAAADDVGRRGEVGAVALRELVLHPLRLADSGERLAVLDGAAAALGRRAVERSAADSDELHGVLRRDDVDRVASVREALERVLGLNADDVGDRHRVELHRRARDDALAEGGRAGEHVRVRTLLGDLGDDGGHLLREAVGVLLAVDGEHVGDAVDGGELRGGVLGALGRDERGHGADLGGGGDRGERGGGDGAVGHLSDDERLPEGAGGVAEHRENQ